MRWPDARNRHRIAAWAWVVLIPPSLIWWREALPWIVFMSHYANIASEFAATQAAQLDQKDVDRIAKRVVEMLNARGG